MGYRNSALYTLKYVATMLNEDEDFLRDCSIEMFSADGCLSADDDYPASELSEHIVLLTQVGIENLQQIVADLRAIGDAPPKPAAGNSREKSGPRGPDRMVTSLRSLLALLRLEPLHAWRDRVWRASLWDALGAQQSLSASSIPSSAGDDPARIKFEGCVSSC